MQFLPSCDHVNTAIWMHYMDINKTAGEKAWQQLHKNACEQYWTGPGGNTSQSSSYTATYHPSLKLSKLDEPDMQHTVGEVGTSS